MDFNTWLKNRDSNFMEADHWNDEKLADDEELADAYGAVESAYGKHDYARANANATPEERKKCWNDYQLAKKKYEDLKKSKLGT